MSGRAHCLILLFLLSEQAALPPRTPYELAQRALLRMLSSVSQLPAAGRLWSLLQAADHWTDRVDALLPRPLVPPAGDSRKRKLEEKTASDGSPHTLAEIEALMRAADDLHLDVSLVPK